MKKLFTTGFYLLLFLFAGVMASCGDDDDDNKGGSAGGGGEEVTVTYPAELTGLWYAVSSTGTKKTETGGSSWTKKGCTHWYELQADGNAKLYTKADEEAVGVLWCVIDGKLQLRRLDTDELIYPGSVYVLSDGGQTLTITSDYVKDGATIHQVDVFSRTKSADGDADRYVPMPEDGIPTGPISGVWTWKKMAYGNGTETEKSVTYEDGEIYFIFLNDSTGYGVVGAEKVLFFPLEWQVTDAGTIELVTYDYKTEYTVELSDENNALRLYCNKENGDWEEWILKRVDYWPEFTLE